MKLPNELMLPRIIEKMPEIADPSNQPMPHYTALRAIWAAEVKKYQLYTEVNQETIKLNIRIDAYNLASTIHEKQSILVEIEEAIKVLDEKFPDDMVALCPEYRSLFYNTIRNSVRQQRQEVTDETQAMSTNPLDINAVIANMPVEKANNLLKILEQNSDKAKNDVLQDELRHLFVDDEPGYAEFKVFLDTHTISYMAGYNSKNYQVYSVEDDTTVVLKVDNRFGYAREIHTTVGIPALGKHLLSEQSSRRLTCEIDGVEMTRNLVVLPYCEAGDLKKEARIKRSPSDQIDKALERYSEMLGILREITARGGSFPDMKNGNWLLYQGKLVIADDKSIMPTDEHGIVKSISTISKFSEATASVTPGYSAPELNGSKPVSADHMHVFSWGKNFYEFLTGCNKNFTCRDSDDGYTFRFSHEVFDGPVGDLLKKLIKDCVRTDPNQRISSEQLSNRLASIQSIIASRANDQQNVTSNSQTIHISSSVVEHEYDDNDEQSGDDYSHPADFAATVESGDDYSNPADFAATVESGDDYSNPADFASAVESETEDPNPQDRLLASKKATLDMRRKMSTIRDDAKAKQEKVTINKDAPSSLPGLSSTSGRK